MKTAHNVKLLNGSKQEVSYTGVETVTMPGTDGQDKVFTAGTPIDAMDISPDFSGGDMPLEAPEGYVVRGATIKKPDGAEQVIAKGQTVAGIAGEYVTPGTAKEIEPDFSEGDQTVTAEGDERWSEVTVKKPEGLVPENIPEGIEIAGVPGALKALTLQAVAERTIAGELSTDAVTTVGSYAFYGTKVTDVSFPNCTSVGMSAFAQCSLLSKVSLPACTSIDPSAFQNCKSLTTASLPACTRVTTHAFASCTALETVTLGCDSNFFTVGAPYMFFNCSNLQEIKFMYSGSLVDGALFLPDQYGSTPNQAFYGCSNLKSIHLVGKNSAAGGSAANGWAIGTYMFANCYNLSKVTITGQIGTFRIDTGTHISKAGGFYEIAGSAFMNCSQLASLSLTISASLGFFISDCAFSGCQKLQHLWLNFVNLPSVSSSKAMGLGSSAFAYTPMSNSTYTGTYGQIHVTKNAYPYLRVASGWSAYAARMVSY